MENDVDCRIVTQKVLLNFHEKNDPIHMWYSRYEIRFLSESVFL